MPQFGFYRLGDGIEAPLSIIVAQSAEDAKRQARAAIEAEGLDAIRLWADGQQTIEVRRPTRPTRVGVTPPRHDRGADMAVRKAQGATYRAIGIEFGISSGRVRDIIAASQRRERARNEEPNRAALSVRARNALPHVITEPENDPAERDQRLPGRVAALTKRQIEKVPNLGKQTIVELEEWLWARGLTLDG